MLPPASTRRHALKTLSLLALAAASARASANPEVKAPPTGKGEAPDEAKPLFTISLAQWSLHKALFDKKLDAFDFPKTAKNDYGIDAVEYVNAFYKDKHDAASIASLRKRCDDLGVASLLIMCDGEGNLGDPDEAKRSKAVDNHRKWLEAAKTLGCHSIRVNAQSAGSFEEQQKLAADGLRKLCELADPMNLNVIVENHWGLSSNGQWLSGVMKMVAHPRVGTLPDFGNFDPKEYDRYQGVTDLMPFAKGVSAKSYDFDEVTGEHTNFEFRRMLEIVLKAGYRGRIGIEYEGKKLSEHDGILATKRLLEKLRAEMAATGKFA
jgi:L-ribulose-5-phosphate 3-epimerase